MSTFLDIWTPGDTSEAGPSVDSAGVDVTVERRGEETTVLHLCSDGVYGLWTAALSLDPPDAQKLARNMLAAAFEDREAVVLPRGAECYSPHHGQDYPHPLTQSCFDEEEAHAAD